MCENCRQKREKEIQELLADMVLLANGELPAGGASYDGCENEQDRLGYRMRLLMARCAIVMGHAENCPPSVAAGLIAGMILESEIEVAVEQQQREDAVRRAAPFN